MGKTDFAQILERKLRLHDLANKNSTSYQNETQNTTRLDIQTEMQEKTKEKIPRDPLTEQLTKTLKFDFEFPHLDSLLRSQNKYQPQSTRPDQQKNTYQEMRNAPIEGNLTTSNLSTTTEPETVEPRLYIQSVDGAVYIAWLQLRKLGASHFQMDNISSTEAKKAYRQLAMKLHPDLDSSQNTDKFMTLKAAYSIFECSFRELVEP